MQAVTLRRIQKIQDFSYSIWNLDDNFAAFDPILTKQQAVYFTRFARISPNSKVHSLLSTLRPSNFVFLKTSERSLKRLRAEGKKGSIPKNVLNFQMLSAFSHDKTTFWIQANISSLRKTSSRAVVLHN